MVVLVKRSRSSVNSVTFYILFIQDNYLWHTREIFNNLLKQDSQTQTILNSKTETITWKLVLYWYSDQWIKRIIISLTLCGCYTAFCCNPYSLPSDTCIHVRKTSILGDIVIDRSCNLKLNHMYGVKLTAKSKEKANNKTCQCSIKCVKVDRFVNASTTL